MRGIEGKERAIRYAREHNLPFLGLCLGMQCAIIEFCRHVIGLKEANSTEFREDTPEPVIDLMSEQKQIKGYGGTMRLGSFPCRLVPNSLAAKLYGSEIINERHRHRYEVNPQYHEILLKHGLVISGSSPDVLLCEMIEYPKHPWFVACQFHPEFKSRPERPHPLFQGLIDAAHKIRLGNKTGKSSLKPKK